MDAEAWTAVPMTLDQQQDWCGACTPDRQKGPADGRGGPALVGGVVVRIGDTVMDGSVRGKLERLERQLLGANALGGTA